MVSMMMNEVTQDSEAEFECKVLGANDLTKTYGSRHPFTRSIEVLTGESIEVYSGEIVEIGWATSEQPDDYMAALSAACERNELPEPSQNRTNVTIIRYFIEAPQPKILGEAVRAGSELDIEELDRSPRKVLARLAQHPILFGKIFSRSGILRWIYAAMTGQWKSAWQQPMTQVNYP